VIPLEYFETEAVQILLEIINRPAFKQRVTALGGYNTKKTGDVIL
jgi:hypothetical protein